MKSLEDYGWDERIAEAWKELAADGLVSARVIADFGTSLRVVTPEPVTAELSGKLAHYTSRENVPKVGDWVALRMFETGNAVVESIFGRRNEIARKVSGKQTNKQTIAANIDIAFLLLAVGGDFSVERLRRFLFQLSIHAISPVVVINKSDKTDDIDSFIRQITPFDVPVITTTATEGKGIPELANAIKPGATAILLGSSGVGKSTITNHLLGREQQHVQEVRESDDTGKHTTVHRELFVLPHGGLLIDTPGIRELQLWGTEEDLYGNFDDVQLLTRQCAYTTCQHGTDDGCAVQHALRTGLLTADKYAAFLKMKRELSVLKSRDLAKRKHDNGKSKRSLNRQNRDIRNELREELY